jgi:polysaccharide chain length determinant protein (PEP-CTERM system associated)
MEDTIQRLVSELRSAWRFRWHALVLAWSVCLIGWFIVFVLPDQYEAEARFYVDTTTRLDEVISGITVEADESSQIALVRQAMLSTPSLEAVARDTDLDLEVRDAAEMQELLSELADAINISNMSVSQQRFARDQSDGIFKITFQHADRQKAYAVVDTMLDNFREDVVSGRAQGTADTVKFLEKEIEEYQARLQNKEREIAEFKSQNVGLLPGETGGYFDLLQDKLELLRGLEAEYSVLNDRKSALLEQMRGERPMLEDESGSGIANPQSDLEVRIADLEASIDEMLTLYTDKWPDVIAAREQLEQLYARRDQELAELAESGEPGTEIPSNNPVYQELQISLNRTNVDIAEMEQRIASLRRDVAGLEERVDVVPEVETELASLTRDLDQLRSVYVTLRDRLQQEELRQKRLGWGGVTFRIIDPPKVGVDPVAPMRLQLILLVVIAGLGAGAAFAYLMQLLKPVFIEIGGLRETTGLPVLGAVSMAWKVEHRKQRKHELLVLAAGTGLILVFAVLAVAFMDTGVEWGSEIRRMASL